MECQPFLLFGGHWKIPLIMKPLFLRSKKSTVTLRGAYEGKTVVFYHKGDSIHVVQRQIEKLDKNHVKVRRHEKL